MATLDRILKQLFENKGSDLHLCSGSPILWRVHGKIVTMQDSPVLNPDHVMKLIEEIAPEFSMKEFLETHDTDFSYEAEDARFRVNLFMDSKGPGAVLRLIPHEITTVEQLGLPKAVINLCYLSKGLVVVTGPTGSGKSTTLAALIDHINRNRCEHIITIEDPVEFVHPNKKCLVNQRQVHLHTKNFKSALRAALREDPDILLIGELRDLETIEIAIETAETGHLVFGTLHTNTAASTVERIIEQFPEGKQNQIRQMLSNSLKGVIAQTLLARLDGQGRVAALEVMIVNMAISNMIREGKTYQLPSTIQTGGKEGMMLLNDSLIKLVTAKIVSPKEAYLKCAEKDDFQKRLAQTGFSSDVSMPSPQAPPPPPSPSAGKVRFAAKPKEEEDGAEDRPLTIRSQPCSTDDFRAFRDKMFQKGK